MVNILKIVSSFQREHLLFSFRLGELVVHWKKQAKYFVIQSDWKKKISETDCSD